MGMPERSKKVPVWKKAMFHFSLCFVMGFFSGFAPAAGRPSASTSISQASKSPVVTETSHVVVPTNRSLISHIKHQAKLEDNPFRQSENETETDENVEESVKTEEFDIGSSEEQELVPRKQLIIITPTMADDLFREVFLRRLAGTMRLVPAPVMWIVVERQPESGSRDVSVILRKTGVMYRHLVYRENFTDPEAEMDHQRNMALKHIKEHSLAGIVHFAGLSNIYDLNFFHELRQIEVFGTWPIALLSAHRRRVRMEGPVCDSAQVMGWHIRKMNNETDSKPPIHISSFAFNSSILWDPERWGRPSSSQATPQDSVKFVKEIVYEDESSVKGIPGEKCSRILLWHLPTQPRRFRRPVHDRNIDSSKIQSES